MIKYFFLLILGLGTGAGIYLSLHLGAFKDVHVEKQKYPSLHLVYVSNRGPYHQINSKLEDIERSLKGKKIPCEKTFGHFLDDPDSVDPDRLKSEVGCVISKSNFQFLSGETPNKGLKIQETQNVVYAKFQGSPSIGPMKVYPAAKDFAHDQRLSLRKDVMELYTVQRDGTVHTEYLFFIE